MSTFLTINHILLLSQITLLPITISYILLSLFLQKDIIGITVKF